MEYRYSAAPARDEEEESAEEQPHNLHGVGEDEEDEEAMSVPDPGIKRPG